MNINKLHGKINIYNGKNIFVATYMHYQFGGGNGFNVDVSSLDFSFVSRNHPALKKLKVG